MKTSLVQVIKGICLFIGLSSLTSFVSGREAPDRVILFIIDGLSVEAPDKIDMPHYNALKK